MLGMAQAGGDGGVPDSLIHMVVDILVGNRNRFRRASDSVPRQSVGHPVDP